jgi:hypothetical protein
MIGKHVIMAQILALVVFSGIAFANPTVVINEIMYAPTTSQNGSLNEWVELYNYGDASVDISGWKVTDNHGKYTFPSGTVIPPGGYIVVCRRTNLFWDYYGNSSRYSEAEIVLQNHDYVYGNATFVLSNSGDDVILEDANGNVIDWVHYSPSWGADGNGKTLERIDPRGDSNSSSNWAESEIVGGTPTYKNTVYVPFFGSYLLVVVAILLVARKLG